MGDGDLHAGILLWSFRRGPAPRARMPLRTLFSRETRLLVTTLAVSVGVLFLLARYRFPNQADGPPSIVPRPLDRWVATSSYDELAAAIDDARLRVAPAMEVLRIVPSNGAALAADVASETDYVPALRFRDGLAMTVVPEGFEIAGFAGAISEKPILVGRDTASGLSVVRVPPKTVGVLATAVAPLPTAPVFLTEAFGAPNGAALRPAFAGRAVVVDDARWDVPLVGLHPSSEFVAGRLLFTMDGRLAGMTVRVVDGIALVPGAAVVGRAEALLQGPSSPPASVGIAVQALTPSLRRAVGATQGVVVREVSAEGPASRLVRVGDVVEAVDDATVDSTEAFERSISHLAPGNEARIRIRRLGASASQDITVVAAAVPTSADAGAPAPILGLTLKPATNGGVEIVAVAVPSVAHRAGLRVGDVITQVGADLSPRPAAIDMAFGKLQAGASLLLGVSRQGHGWVIGLDKP